MNWLKSVKHTNKKMQVIWCTQHPGNAKKPGEHSRTSTRPPPSLTPGFILPRRLRIGLTPRVDWWLASLRALIFTSGRSENKTNRLQALPFSKQLTGPCPLWRSVKLNYTCQQHPLNTPSSHCITELCPHVKSTKCQVFLRCFTPFC